MMISLSNRVVCILVTAIILVSFGCSSNQTQPNEYKIDILLFGSHPLVLSVADGIKAGANERLSSLGRKDTFVFNNHDAGFQVTEATQQTKQAILNKPAAIIALGTPSIKVALAQRDNGTPIYFGATSDPKSLGITSTNDPDDWQKPNAFNIQPNVFGIVTDFQYERMAKLIQKIVELTQNQVQNQCIRIGYPLNEAESNSVLALQKLDSLLQPTNFCFTRSPVASPTDIPGATRFLMSKGVVLIQIGPDNTVAGGVGSILSITRGKRIPVLASERESVKRGAVAAYGVDFYQLGKLLGTKLVDELLKTNTSNQVEVFSKSKLYVNTPAINELFGPASVQDIGQYLGINDTEIENLQ